MVQPVFSQRFTGLSYRSCGVGLCFSVDHPKTNLLRMNFPKRSILCRRSVLLLSFMLFPAGASGLSLLTEPFLQLPGEDSVVVAWMTEFEGTAHTVTYGTDLDQTAVAVTSRLTRMFEDGSSDLFNPSGNRIHSSFTERPVWRHEAVVTGLVAGERVPYFVTSEDGSASVVSGTYTLQPKPAPGQAVQIVLTSDHQNRAMNPGTWQKLVETVGTPDLVLMAGDYADHPNRASEWYDRQNESRPPYFPTKQGTIQNLFPDHPYAGGEVLQHAPIMGVPGNHEVSGRFAKHAQGAGINAVWNDPQPRWYAEVRYDQRVAAGELTPPEDPEEAAAFRAQWIEDHSFEMTSFLEIWTHPDDSPGGEGYWSISYGDVFIIGMHVNTLWRHWHLRRGKFSEQHLNNTDEWGFGDMFFEDFSVGSEQYEWLVDVLASEEFQNSKYRVLMGHKSMFGLGDNALPVMANPIATITYEWAGGRLRTMQWEGDVETFVNEVQPKARRGEIVHVYYEYPIENDIWKNDIEPLLLEHEVQLVLTGHSHLWNRSRVGLLNYLESSNYGDTHGVGYADENIEVVRAPWANFPGEEGSILGPDPADYPRTGDPHGRPAIFPTHANPEQLWNSAVGHEVPFISSNDIGVFTVLDTGTGLVRSWAYNWHDPESEPILFDVFPLNPDFHSWARAAWDETGVEELEPGDDPGGLGIPLALRYALGLDARAPDRALLPAVLRHDDPETGEEYVVLQYQRRVFSSGVNITLEGADAPGAWSVLNDPLLLDLAGDGERDILSFRDTVPVAPDQPRFLRLKVEVEE